MKNPFYFGKEVYGEAFTNRREEIKELLSDIEQGINVVLFSPRRYGKTSLIKKVLEKTREQNILAVYLDLFPLTSLKDFIKIYSYAIAQAKPASIFKELLKMLEKYLPRLLPRVVLKPKGGTEIIFDLDKVLTEKESVLDELLETVHLLAKRKGLSAVVVFDEFQEISKLDEGEKLEKEIRSHIQTHQNVSYVFMGSKRHLMQEMFKNKNRPLYNCGRHLTLRKISRGDFSNFINHQFFKADFSIQNDKIDQILDITECHPYYTQLFCHLLWDRCRDIKRITLSDIKNTLSQLLIEEEHSFSIIWDELSAVQRVIVSALAKDEKPALFSQAFMIEYGLKSISSVQKARKTLEKKEIIERSNGNFMLSDLLFKKWVVKLSRENASG